MTINAKNILYNEKDPVFRAWFHILKHAPTPTWEQPILMFIDSTKEKLSNDKIEFSTEGIDQCNNFMRNIARYIYAKSLANEPNDELSIKQEMLKATELAKEKKLYDPDIKITNQFEQKLNGNIPQKLRWGLCAIVEFSRNFDEFIERESKLKKSVLESTVVEQIFPDNWEPAPLDPWHEFIYGNKPDLWNSRKINKALKTIGNLILVEQDIYKNTKNLYTGNFLAKRRKPKIGKGYSDSIFNEVALICQTRWNPALWDIPFSYNIYIYRQKYSVERLTDFFSDSSECILR
jgi:hypothetical protein